MMDSAEPVRKIRSRIRIGPGGVMYLICTGLILGAAIYTQANLLFWALGLMIGGLIVSILLAWRMLRGIRVQRLLPSHGVADDPLVLRYHLTNRSWLPVFSLMVQESWGRGGRGWKKVGPIAQSPQRLRGRPNGWILHLGPHQAIQAEAQCWPMRRGLLAFDRIILSSSFPFGIIRKVVEFHQPAQVLIYPHLYRMNRRLLYSLSNLDPSGRKQVEKGGGTEEFFGIRPYRAGDSLKLIEWKRTASTGKLVAREMTQPSPPRVMILLDLSARPSTSDDAHGNGQAPRDPDSLHPRPRGLLRRRKQRRQELERARRGDDALASDKEKAICLAASLVCDAHFHGYQIGLAVKGATCPVFPVHHSLPHRTRLLEALAGLDLDKPAEPSLRPGDRPSVIVWPGPGDTMPDMSARGTAAVLGAADLDLYVNLTASPSQDLLRRRVRPVGRREEVMN